MNGTEITKQSRLNGSVSDSSVKRTPRLNGSSLLRKESGHEINGAANVKKATRKANGHATALGRPAINGTKVSKPNGLQKSNGSNQHRFRTGAKPLNGSVRLGPARLAVPRSGKNLVLQDRMLVDRCISGEAAAWSQIYDRFHGSLLASIRAFLGRAGQDIHLVDEVSARVWYSLVRNGFELLAKFDPARGCRLSTFLSVLGKSEARLLLRSERRRKTREYVASRPEIEHPDGIGAGVLADDDFLATLSPRERAYYLEILVAPTECADESNYSRQNQWQLRHRVRKKLEQFLE